MRIPSLTGLSLVVGALLVPASFAEAAEREIRDAVTGDQLAKQYEKTSLNDPLASLKANQVEAQKDPTKLNQPADLLETSDFLSFGGMSTLIPKQAVLHVPKNYQNRIKLDRGSKLVIWPEFYRSNRGWIKTVEVTREQAQGVEPFDEKVAEAISKSSIVVIATFKGGPISVLPPKEPETPKEGDEGTDK